MDHEHLSNGRSSLSVKTTSWHNRRVAVTGGAGFLGSAVVGKLREHGANDIFVPRSKDYDLRDADAIRKLLTDSQPHVVIHLAARAYWLALEHGKPGGVYNVGSGVRRSVGEMLELLLSLTSASIQVMADPTGMRPSDVKVLHADATKFRRATDWGPEISFEQMMRDLLEWWRGQLRRYQVLATGMVPDRLSFIFVEESIC